MTEFAAPGRVSFQEQSFNASLSAQEASRQIEILTAELRQERSLGFAPRQIPWDAEDGVWGEGEGHEINQFQAPTTSGETRNAMVVLLMEKGNTCRGKRCREPVGPVTVTLQVETVFVALYW